MLIALQIVATLITIILVVSFIFSGIVMHSRRQPIVRTPDEYGMEYEDVSFQSTDGVETSGWFIPAKSGKSDQVLILTHPMPMNRHGFLAKNQGFPPLFRTDVDLLKSILALHQAGYPVLAFDLRNHGESGRGITGNGLSEYQDVLGAIRYINARHDLQVKDIGLVGFCMGAASAMTALSKGKYQITNARFLVAIQPVTSIVFFKRYMASVYTPLSLFLIPIVNQILKWRGGYSLEEMAPGRFAKDIEIPTMYVQAREDPWTELSDIQGFYESTPGAEELWFIEGKMGRFDAYNFIGEQPEKVLAFVNRHFSA
ncbi:MAG: alpha/beta fold hydrolase [Anaerolineales bacterium]|nr:alpha/beta fold hydrolase [Anaerolineales bacterium]